MLEVQKLAYFLQVAGEPLRLNFTKGAYGPYAEALNHVLQRMEGHFIRGYSDRTGHSTVTLTLQPAAAQEARHFLENRSESLAHWRRVADLITGFETPYGMELLVTVHWVAQENSAAKTDPAAAVQGVQAWSPRKQARFQPAHINVAWQRLHDRGWL
jgi:hypothetical protein